MCGRSEMHLVVLSKYYTCSSLSLLKNNVKEDAIQRTCRTLSLKIIIIVINGQGSRLIHSPIYPRGDTDDHALSQ